MKKKAELGEADFRAVRLDGAVLVVATGRTPSPNYKVWLKQTEGAGKGGAKLELWWVSPDQVDLQLPANFRVHLVIPVPKDQKMDQIEVRDANGLHTIPVKRDWLANSFSLSHGSTHVRYEFDNWRPFLQIGHQLWWEDELHVEADVALGRRVTVITEKIADLRTVYFTLIIPPVWVQATTTAVVDVPAVIATHHEPFAGPPPPAQAITYEIAMLSGFAEHIFF